MHRKTTVDLNTTQGSRGIKSQENGERRRVSRFDQDNFGDDGESGNL
jgi:hypothetical protein